METNWSLHLLQRGDIHHGSHLATNQQGLLQGRRLSHRVLNIFNAYIWNSFEKAVKGNRDVLRPQATHRFNCTTRWNDFLSDGWNQITFGMETHFQSNSDWMIPGNCFFVRNLSAEVLGPNGRGEPKKRRNGISRDATKLQPVFVDMDACNKTNHGTRSPERWLLASNISVPEKNWKTIQWQEQHTKTIEFCKNRTSQ